MSICEDHSGNIQYLEQINKLIHSPSFLQEKRIKPQDFTRSRKLTFPMMVSLSLSKSDYALKSRLNLNFDNNLFSENYSVPTSSAFVQARYKLDPEVFTALLDYSNVLFYQNTHNNYTNHTWKGHPLLAVDGSRLSLPDTQELETHFSRMCYRTLPAGVIQANTVCLYDPLNNLPLKMTFGKVEAEKKPFLNDIIPFIKEGPLAASFTNAILLFDRLYIDYGMFGMLIKHNLKFCIRSKTSATFKVITDFVKSDQNDAILTFKCPTTQKSFAEQENLPKDICLRAIKVTLDTGEVEILITNIFNKEFYPPDCFKELYFKRWGVETGFYFLKTFLNLQKFSSEKLQFILQDFHATIFLYAMCEMIKKEEDQHAQELAIYNKRKFNYQVGIANLITSIQNHVMELFSQPNLDITTLYRHISKQIQADLSPIRLGRSYKRRPHNDSKMLVYHLGKKRSHS